MEIVQQEGGNPKRQKLEAAQAEPLSLPNASTVPVLTGQPIDARSAQTYLSLARNSSRPIYIFQGSPETEADSKDELGAEGTSEDKKLRRKQSNRESARRSRLRKQAECEALTHTVTELRQENISLKAENKAMLLRIEDLKARLEERIQGSGSLFRPTPINGAFKPVLPSLRPLAPDAEQGHAGFASSLQSLGLAQLQKTGQITGQESAARS